MFFATGDETVLSIGFEISAYTVMENEEEVSVCLSADGGIGTEVFEVYMWPLDISTQGVLHSYKCMSSLHYNTLRNSR